MEGMVLRLESFRLTTMGEAIGSNDKRFWSQTAWNQVLVLPLTNDVALGKILNLPKPQFLHLKN